MESKRKNFTEKIGGIKLGKANYIMLAVTLSVSVILLISNYSTLAAYRELKVIMQDYIVWHTSADEIEYASDYLTEQVRYFSMTGNKNYSDKYFEESDQLKHRERALDNIEDLVFDQESYDALEVAVNGSFLLMETEFYSMRLTVEGYGLDVGEFHEKIREVVLSNEDSALSAQEKIEKARVIVFDSKYESAKETIKGNVNDCIKMLDDQFLDKQVRSTDRLNTMFYLEQVLIAVYVVLVLLIITLVAFNVLSPLNKAIPFLKAEDKVPVRGAYEYRYLAETYNRIYDINKQNTEKLMKEVSHDALTGIYNRREFVRLLEKKDKEIVALLLFDVDHFKLINDVNGHDMGDVVLMAVSQKIEEIFVGAGHTCRIGGDEIAVIVTDHDLSREEIYNKAFSINQRLATDYENLPKTTCSVGVAYSEEGVSNSLLFKHADKALYATKKNGRNGVTVYNSSDF